VANIVKIKVFVVEYENGDRRETHPESLTQAVAFALGRELARRGRKPVVHRIDLTPGQLDDMIRQRRRPA